MRKKHIHRTILLVLLAAFIVSGCAYFEAKKKEKERELLPVRNVRVVPFPVRPLEFDNPKVRQDKDQLTISGSIKNISYSPVTNVYVHAIVFFANDETTKTLDLAVVPSTLQPGESGEFLVDGLAEEPVNRVELHVEWEPYYPPGL